MCTTKKHETKIKHILFCKAKAWRFVCKFASLDANFANKTAMCPKVSLALEK